MRNLHTKNENKLFEVSFDFKKNFYKPVFIKKEKDFKIDMTLFDY